MKSSSDARHAIYALPLRPQSIRDLSHAWTGRGEGNVISVEFNLMYRWHPAISMEDTTWMEHFFNGLFHGKPSQEVCDALLRLRDHATEYVYG